MVYLEYFNCVVFCFLSAVFVLYPYLTIHMRELGINVEETAIMSALTPCVAILMPPVAGMIADRIGNFKVNNFSISVAMLCIILLENSNSEHCPKR